MNNKLKFLIACSGGPDSMALLDMSYKDGLTIEVAHVNYHKRKTALRDEKIVKKYCKDHNIPFHRLNYVNQEKGNFQENARIARYKYFAKICKKQGLDAVLVAHHMDDAIETYYMQIEKGIVPQTFGLSEMNYLYGVNVIRPLLKYTKKDLLDYCEDNYVEYGIDESNLTDDYTRNKVRHKIVDKLTLKEKKSIMRSITATTKRVRKDIERVDYLLSREDIKADQFFRISNLDEFLANRLSIKSHKGIEELLRQLKDSERFYMEDSGYILEKKDGLVNFFQKPFPYKYTFETEKDLRNFKCAEFKVSSKGESVNGVHLTKNDFPITIRNYQKGDSIEMKYGTKKINRFFIDKKMKTKDRLSWPIMFDKKGNAILVPNLGCDVHHYASYNFFMIK